MVVDIIDHCEDRSAFEKQQQLIELSALMEKIRKEIKSFDDLPVNVADVITLEPLDKYALKWKQDGKVYGMNFNSMMK